MTLRKKLNSKRGFTLAELLIVVAIIAILAGTAFIFVNPQDISYEEYNRSAEAIATAVQNRLIEIRNAGDMEKLRVLGLQSSQSEETRNAVETANFLDGESSDGTYGGYRYVFNYSVETDGTAKKADLSYLLPFGTIEYELTKNYYAIGFQSDTGMVGEVFYTVQPFNTDALTADYLVSLAGNPEKRKAENVGYYQGKTYDSEMAFANLPTPQLTITNYEELTLSIYLPKVKQLSDYGKNLGILVSLSDEDGEAFEKGLTLNQTAIYSTFSLGISSFAIDVLDPQAITVEQKISSGTTYNIILDTVKKCDEFAMQQPLSSPLDEKEANIKPPKADFESWAKRSKAFKDGYYLLGDNSTITVTVYCLYQEGDKNYDENFPVDPTFMPRSASVTFNGWFNNYGGGSVDIACGRHLQNLGKMTELRSQLEKYLPTATKGEDGVYAYSDYNYGMANTYTDGSSNSSPKVEYDHITEKYVRRNHVKEITKANQINAIDFDNSDWKDEDGNPIPFMPIYPSTSFSYYGNYLTISHLYVDAPFYAGLFGYAYHAKLYDILLVNPTVKSQMPAHLAELYEMGVGALIGTSRHSSDIYNCQVYMSQENKTYNPDYRVEGSCYVGGLIGFCEDEDIQNCSASVYTGYKKGATKLEAGKEISLSSKYVGGLIGCITGDCEIENCYAAGNLTGAYVGGLIGFIKEDSDPSGDDYRVETCYTAGHIEYAEKEAAGILGYISELAGNAKSALSIAKNYCVIIYGKKEGTGYAWKSEAPIYPTFKGDGFEWLRTDQLGFSDSYLTGTYAGQTFFAGASFKRDNRNYYIAQKGIIYSNSPYYESMYQAVKDLFAEIEKTTDKAQLLEKIEAAKQEIVWYKKLQTLEELKRIMETAIYEVENETGKDINGKAYNIGGYKDAKEYYLNLDTQNAEIVRKSNSYTVKLSAAQAIHAIYDGTYTDDSGVQQTIEITDKNHNKKNAAETGAIDNFTFMGFYNALQTAYKALLDSDPSNDQSANETLKYIFGDNTSETYTGKDSSGNAKEYYYYQAGRFYASFYDHMLFKLFDVCKDYYDAGASEHSMDDNNGELIYRHFRSDLAGKFLEVMVDLGMSPSERDRFLLKSKQDAIQDAIDELKNYKKITALWTDGTDDDGNPLHPMHKHASTVDGYVDSAVTALQSLLTTLKGTFTTAQLQEKMNAAEAALKPLYDFFNDDAEIIKNTVDIISTDKDEDGNYLTGDMRNLRDPVLVHRRNVALCIATANSSVENALDDLKIKVNEGGDIKKLLTDFTDEVNGYLGVEWGFTDSGHRLKNSEEMRNAARGFPYGHTTDTREPSGLGFMYNYGESSSKNPYKDVFKNDAYVNDDHGIYNNVFPYTENEHTKYYPFPFVYGRSTQNSNGFRATYVLFHYGDWLTEDLWASPVQTALSELDFQLTKLNSELQSASEAAGSSGDKGNIKKAIDALSTEIKETIETIGTKIGTATKQDLTDIKNDIKAWLHESTGNKDQDGVFVALEKLIDGEKDKPNMKDIVNLLDLGAYKKQLNDLLENIEKILTES